MRENFNFLVRYRPFDIINFYYVPLSTGVSYAYLIVVVVLVLLYTSLLHLAGNSLITG